MRAALLVAAINLALSVAWILASSAVAARLASSVEQLEAIEARKGLAFVFAMSLILGGVTWLLLERVRRRDVELATQRQALIDGEARAMAGIVAGSVAHDMNNLLAVALGHLELQREEGGDAAADAEPVLVALDRMRGLATRLQVLGREALPGTNERFDLAVAVRESHRLAARHPTARAGSHELVAPDRLPFAGNEALISRIVTNLALNAVEAAPPDGRTRLVLEARGAEAVLEVHDDGPGVPVERREIIFEPFHSTKQRGSGLGLVSVKAAAREHGGTVEVDDSPLGGACFRVRLPLWTDGGAAATRGAGAAPGQVTRSSAMSGR